MPSSEVVTGTKRGVGKWRGALYAWQNLRSIVSVLRYPTAVEIQIERTYFTSPTDAFFQEPGTQTPGNLATQPRGDRCTARGDRCTALWKACWTDLIYFMWAHLDFCSFSSVCPASHRLIIPLWSIGIDCRPSIVASVASLQTLLKLWYPPTSPWQFLVFVFPMGLHKYHTGVDDIMHVGLLHTPNQLMFLD